MRKSYDEVIVDLEHRAAELEASAREYRRVADELRSIVVSAGERTAPPEASTGGPAMTRMADWKMSGPQPHLPDEHDKVTEPTACLSDEPDEAPRRVVLAPFEGHEAREDAVFFAVHKLGECRTGEVSEFLNGRVPANMAGWYLRRLMLAGRIIRVGVGASTKYRVADAGPLSITEPQRAPEEPTEAPEPAQDAPSPIQAALARLDAQRAAPANTTGPGVARRRQVQEILLAGPFEKFERWSFRDLLGRVEDIADGKTLSVVLGDMVRQGRIGVMQVGLERMWMRKRQTEGAVTVHSTSMGARA